jgi:glycerol-3-phosphate cytidylyltransferase
MIKNKIIYTAGSFDLFHEGHLRILEKAKKLGTYLIVAVSTDELIKQCKKIDPIIPYVQRVAIIKGLRCVDKVIPEKIQYDIKEFKKQKADIYVIGSDWKYRYDNKLLNWFRKHRKIVFLPYTRGISSSLIKAKIIINAEKINQAQKERNRSK